MNTTTPPSTSTGVGGGVTNPDRQQIFSGHSWYMLDSMIYSLDYTKGVLRTSYRVLPRTRGCRSVNEWSGTRQP